jgi:hypothetical protein
MPLGNKGTSSLMTTSYPQLDRSFSTSVERPNAGEFLTLPILPALHNKLVA